MYEKTFWLIGVSLNPDNERVDLYTLFLPGEKDEPLHAENYLLFFSKPQLASKAISLCDNNTDGFGPPPHTVDAICDVATTLYYVAYENTDPDATIIFCLNTLFDLVNSTNLLPPPQYKSQLYAFADHLTFSRDISTFFEEPH